MNLIICLANNNGICFNHRRLSRDAAVISDIAGLVGEGSLRIHPYSLCLFEESGIPFICGEDYLSAAADDDFVFVESDAYTEFEDSIDRLIIYHWNRSYPADSFFRMDMSAFEREEIIEFAGNSHEKLERELFNRL